MPETLAPRPSRYTEAEWAVRLDLAACYRLTDHFGLSDIIWNHITAKIPQTGHFLINRFGLRYDEITASNLVTLDTKGNVMDPGAAASEKDINTTGFIIHGAVHASRSDVMCVMHTHAAAGLAVSVLEEGLIPMILDALPLFGKVAYHDCEGLSVDPDEQSRLANHLGDASAMILRNHGLLTCGATVGEAFMTMLYLERACRVQLDVLATGRKLRLPDEALCRRVAKQAQHFRYGQYEWPALLRLVDSKYPDYRL